MMQYDLDTELNMFFFRKTSIRKIRELGKIGYRSFNCEELLNIAKQLLNNQCHILKFFMVLNVGMSYLTLIQLHFVLFCTVM